MLRHKPSLTLKSLAALAVGVLSFLGQNGGVVEATFSVAGTDSATQQVGAAGASCVANESIYDFLYQGVPGHGVLITQAKPAVPGTAIYQIGEAMLLNGTNPFVIVETITDPSIDDVVVTLGVPNCGGRDNITYEEYKLRQYGCVDLMGRSAGYEDPTLKEYYYDLCTVEGEGKYYNYTQEHTGGTAGTFTYSAQGNVVTDTTVPALATNFVGQDGNVGCDLADRLYRAITSIPLMFREALETEDESLIAGDVRCFPGYGAVAHGMFLHVDNPDGTKLVHIDIIGEGDPFPAFQEAYDAWRSDNSCPETTTTEAPSSVAGGTAGTETPAGTPSGGTSWMPSLKSAVWAFVVAVPLFP